MKNKKRLLEKDISCEMLKSQIEYDSLTGSIVRKSGERGGNGYIHKTLGYRIISICGVSLYAHRIAWCYWHGAWPVFVIDHVNGNRVDNRICNLRDVPRLLNSHNRHVNKSRINAPGVQKIVKSDGSAVYRSKITIGKKQFHLGSFKNIEQAQAIYAEAKSGVFDAFNR